MTLHLFLTDYCPVLIVYISTVRYLFIVYISQYVIRQLKVLSSQDGESSVNNDSLPIPVLIYHVISVMILHVIVCQIVHADQIIA